MKKIALLVLLLLACDFAAQAPPTPGFTVLGIVRKADGSIATDANVSVKSKDNGALLWNGKTNDKGVYSTGSTLRINQGTGLVVSASARGLSGTSEVVLQGSGVEANVVLQGGSQYKSFMWIGILAIMAVAAYRHLSGKKKTSA